MYGDKSDQNELMFGFFSKHKSFILRAETLEIKNEWLKLVNKISE